MQLSLKVKVFLRHKHFKSCIMAMYLKHLNKQFLTYVHLWMEWKFVPCTECEDFFLQFMLMYWLFKASLMFASLHLVLIFIVNTVYILISLIKSTSLDCISLCCCCFHFRSFRALSYDAFIQLVFIVNITRIWISFVQIKLKLYRLLVVVVFVVVV